MQVIELRPDTRLLKSNFDGYKLSLEPIPVLKQELSSAPDRVQRNDNSEYSFLHVSLFQLHNHLVSDPWLQNTAYFLDSNFTIQKIHYDTNSGKLKPNNPVFRNGKISRELGATGIYNCDFKFISEKYTIFSDGIGTLKLLDTGDRLKSVEWKNVFSVQPLDENHEGGFLILDAKFLIDNGEQQVHILTVHVHQIESKFFAILNWIVLKQNQETKEWSTFSRRTLKGKGNPCHVSFDPKCCGLVYSSNHPFDFIFDSINEVLIEEEVIAEESSQMDSVDNFTWCQDGEDITVTFKVIPGMEKENFIVNCQETHVEVTCEAEMLVKSDIFASIDLSLTTWSFENGSLQLSLIKKEAETFWPYLIPGGPEEFKEGQLPVADLNSQMEECDFGNGQEGDNDYFIQRLDGTTHKITHKIFLGCNAPLFSITLRAGFPKAIATRFDVDCCLWLQNVSPQDNTDWSLKHEGTLHAFGYIQASKQQRKYLSCSPDLNLAVICESSRHLFIYKNSYATAGGLRKRTGSQMAIGQQKLVAFDSSNGEILGISVENEFIFVLCENTICCLQLCIEE